MRDEPSGAALLDIARQTLMAEVVPGLDGKARYAALMVANAMAIVGREIEGRSDLARAWEKALSGVAAAGGPEASAERLVQAIRAGEHDADPVLHGALLETARAAAEIWKPSQGQARKAEGPGSAAAERRADDAAAPIA